MPAGGSPSRPRSCTVTLPNGKPPPAAALTALPPLPPAFHGNGRLWVKLWPLGAIVDRHPRADGSIGVKLPWWRGLAGRLRISGRRLDAKAPPLRARVPSGYGSSGFQPSGVVFPSEGCWRVTGRVGRARLSFVVLVVEAARNGY